MSEDGLAIEGRGIAVRYRMGRGEPLSILVNFDIGAARGEFLAIAGRSGSGKTSLLNVLACLQRPSDGRVLWNGEDVTDAAESYLAPSRREMLGIVFQGGGLIPTLTAAENVALASFGQRNGHDKDRSLTLLALVGVADRARHFPSELSGGEQQRVSLARALFRNPDVLIVDEPTANLDRRTANGVVELLSAVHSDGRTLLVASHDPTLLAAADRLVDIEAVNEPARGVVG
jgi:putative ABC transport system ATP-binding protein